MDQQQVELQVEDNNSVTQGQQNTSVQEVAQVNSTVESDQDKNWKKFKEARALERKQAEESAKKAAEKQAEVDALKAALEAVVNKPQHQQSHTQYDQTEETEDQRIEKKVQAALAVAEQRRQEELKKHEQETYGDRLVSNFSDFNQVCTSGNIDYLEYHYPEVAEAFKHAPDGYAKWAAVYKAVKRFVPNTDSRKDQIKAEKNFLKPQSISSPGMTKSGETMPSYMLTEERKAANWARMQKASKGLS